jgi:hypothetical protein
MTETTRPATWEDVLHVVRLLQKHGTRFVLVGGYALAAHGYIRATVDIDFGVSPEPENSRKWVLALSELPDGVAKELIGEDDPFEGDHAHAIRINDEITIDIMPSVAGLSFDDLLSQSVDFHFDDVVIPVLDLQGLYRTKQNSVRPKDQADALVLKQALLRQK